MDDLHGRRRAATGPASSIRLELAREQHRPHRVGPARAHARRAPRCRRPLDRDHDRRRPRDGRDPPHIAGAAPPRDHRNRMTTRRARRRRPRGSRPGAAQRGAVGLPAHRGAVRGAGRAARASPRTRCAPGSRRARSRACCASSRRSSTPARSATRPRSSRRRSIPIASTRPPRSISRHPGVSHNYKRNHAYNLWYTLAVPPGDDIDEHLDVLHRESGSLVTRKLPTLTALQDRRQARHDRQHRGRRARPRCSSTSGPSAREHMDGARARRRSRSRRSRVVQEDLADDAATVRGDGRAARRRAKSACSRSSRASARAS